MRQPKVAAQAGRLEEVGVDGSVSLQFHTSSTASPKVHLPPPLASGSLASWHLHLRLHLQLHLLSTSILFISLRT